MRKKLSVGMLAVVGLVCVSSISSAATLDDVMARLDRLQRDNEAMRKEIAALRRKEERSNAVQAVGARNASSRALPPAASSAMAAYPVKGGYVEPPRPFSWNGLYLGRPSRATAGVPATGISVDILVPPVFGPLCTGAANLRSYGVGWAASRVAPTIRLGNVGLSALRPSFRGHGWQKHCGCHRRRRR